MILIMCTEWLDILLEGWSCTSKTLLCQGSTVLVATWSFLVLVKIQGRSCVFPIEVVEADIRTVQY